MSILYLYLCAIVGICSSSGPEVQLCGNSAYYCTVNGQCLPRSDRCVERRNCITTNGIEEGCDCIGSRCSIYLGTAPLPSSGSSSKKRNVGFLGYRCLGFLAGGGKAQHQFINYKGFTWEFGESYQVQILDINDPDYKYRRQSEPVNSITQIGSSSCTYDQALAYANDFNRRYCLCTNNCQHFAQGLSKWLQDDCIYRGKRQINETLSEYFTEISQQHCDEDLINNTDITFVLDTSGSISVLSFQYVREFIEDVVLEMNIGPNNSRVAVILFDSSARLYFNLNAFADKDSLLMSIRNLPYSGGRTDIPEALNLLRITAQSGSLGIRADNRQIAIFLTDGQGGNVVPAVAALAATNIFQVYSVGVDGARLDQLNLIALNNTDFVYYHSTFTNTSLVVIAESIIERLKEQFIDLQPRLGSMLGGTFIQLIGNNIKFQEGATYTCLFDQTEVEGMYLSEDKVLCVSPILRSMGRIKFSLSVSDPLIGTQKTILLNDTFFSLPVEDSNIIESADLLLLLGNKTVIRWSPDSIIEPHLQEAFALTNNYSVDISLYQLDLASESYTLIEKIASDVPNTGIYEITIPSVDLSENFAAGVIGISLSEQFASRSTRNVFTDIALGLLKRAPKFGLVYIGASLAARAICSAWLSLEPKDIGETISNRLPPCPPVIDAAIRDPVFNESNHFGFSFFHPGASSCFRQVMFTSENEGSGQQCCYDDNGRLIVGPPGGGTVDLYSPGEHFWKHQLHDVLPFIFCCKGLFSDCSAYYDRRPSDDGDGYDLTPPATAIGDPHVITLDGFQYTFNGKGEFLLIDHVNGRFTLQGRMIDIREALSSFRPATVFSAVVGKQNDSDIVQFEVNQQRNGIDIIVNGKMINLDGIFQENFNNVTIFNLGDDTFAAAFSSGCSVRVKEENGFISVFSVTAPSSFKGRTRGIMGNYNGDTTDDLMARNGTEPLLHNSSIEVIHYEFGITWFVNKSESLFTYNQQIDQSWESFYDPTFRPLFNIIPLFPESICGNNTFCLYDISATGNAEIGLSTLNSSNVYDEIVQLSYPVICEPPCAQGACVSNDTCNCVEGYVGERCTEPVYSECEVELCTNGGSCRKLGSSYICECANGYSGLDCEIAPSTDDDDDHLIMIGVPIIVVVASILLLLITTLCLYYNCRSKKYEKA